MPPPSPPPLSLWDKLPEDVERRIFAHALVSQLHRPSRAKSDLWMLLGRTRRIAHPPSLSVALRRLAEHLGSPVDAPGEEEPTYMGVQRHRHRLLRHDEHHLVRARWARRGHLAAECGYLASRQLCQLTRPRAPARRSQVLAASAAS